MPTSSPGAARLYPSAAAVAAALPPRPPRVEPTFLGTLEHRRFTEFADTVRTNRMIGLCTGAPGIGKTLSARQYSGATAWETWVGGGYAKDPTTPAVTLARLTRYPQLYSRVGFAHYYRPLNNTDLLAVLTHHWADNNQTLDPTNPDHAEAIAAVTRITGGNFRLIDRLLAQTRRIMTINGIHTITLDAIEAARATLVIGSWTRHPPCQTPPKDPCHLPPKVTHRTVIGGSAASRSLSAAKRSRNCSRIPVWSDTRYS